MRTLCAAQMRFERTNVEATQGPRVKRGKGRQRNFVPDLPPLHHFFRQGTSSKMKLQLFLFGLLSFVSLAFA